MFSRLAIETELKKELKVVFLMSLCKIIDYTYITDPCDHWAVNYQWTSTITNQHNY